ncbi:MAG: hypothetical protein ACXAD7_19320, partial [Candidatus Kariarchaeaceae archaeon]
MEYRSRKFGVIFLSLIILGSSIGLFHVFSSPSDVVFSERDLIEWASHDTRPYLLTVGGGLKFSGERTIQMVYNKENIWDLQTFRVSNLVYNINNSYLVDLQQVNDITNAIQETVFATQNDQQKFSFED